MYNIVEGSLSTVEVALRVLELENEPSNSTLRDLAATTIKNFLNDELAARVPSAN